MKFIRTSEVKSRRASALAGLCVLAGTLSCQMPLAFQDPLSAQQNTAWQTQGRFRAEPTPGQGTDPAQSAQASRAPMQQPAAPTQEPLRSWNGVVEQPEVGSLQTVGTSGHHGLEPSVEGRMHIIELYQEVLDERDQLLTEVHALQEALASSQAMLDDARGKVAGADTRIQALEEGNRILTEESRDMAARLTTSQIRRLEAEKLLLETQISWHRERELASSGPKPVAQPNGDN